MKYSLIVILFISTTVFGQANGDYRSRQTGNWATVTTWQVFNASAWHNLEDIGAGAFQNVTPSSASGAVNLLNTHNVTVAAGVTVDQVVIESGGRLIINPAITLILANGGGSEITVNSGGEVTNNGTINFASGLSGTRQVVVNGTYNNSGTASNLAANELSFGAGSFYYHEFTDGGTIPLASWNATSTTVISNMGPGSSTPPAGRTQNFGNFIWDSPGQDEFSSIELAGAPGSVQGNFIINDTGAGNLIYTSSATPALNVGGDLILNNGIFGYAVTGAPDGSLDVTGNVNLNAGFIQLADGQNLTINIGGNFSISAADADFMASGATVATLNLTGDFSQTGGSISATSGLISFNFVGTTQTYTSSFAATGTVNYYIDGTSSVAIANTSFLGGTTAVSSLTVDGELIVRSTNSAGAIQAGTSAGNLRISGMRLFNSGSRIVYEGTTTQFIGAGHPTTTLVVTEIDNSSAVGIQLAANVTIGGTLELTDGNVAILTRTLTLSGAFIDNGNFLVIQSGSSIVINGTGAFGTMQLSGSSTMNNLTIDRSGETIVLGRDLTIDGTFTHTNGDFDFTGRTLTINGPYTRTGGNLLFDTASTLIIRGSGTISALPFGSTTIGTFTLNNTNGASSSNPITIQTAINLQSGAFTGTGSITMANGSTFTRGNGSTSKAVNTSGSYNLIYNGSTAVVTPTNPVGNELPTSATALNNLTIANSVTLDRNITINGSLTLSNGTFIAGANTINLEGNLISNASADFESAVLNFAGTTTISGTVDPNFNNFTVNASSSLNLGTATTVYISGNITNNGTINGGTSTVIFDGTTSLDGGGTAALKGSFHHVEITATGSLAISCAICTYPTNRFRMEVSGDFIVFSGGIFTENQSIVRLTGTAAQALTMQGQNFFDLELTGANTVTLTEALLISEDLTIGSTSTLNSGAGNYTMSIGDDMIINGTFVPNNNKVIFNGTSTQSVTRTSGSTTINFYDIEINKPASTSFSFETAANLQNAFTFASSVAFSVDFDGLSSTVAKLTLISSSVTGRTGHIMSIPDAASVSGNIITQRFMEPEPSGSRIYRYISSPVVGAAASLLQDDFPLTGTFTGASTCAAFTPGARNMYRYNEATAGSSSLGYVGFPTSNVTETLTSGRGYAVQMCDGVSTITWDVTGTIRRATTASPVDFSTVITYTNTGFPNDDGINLVGNPFPAPLDWQAGGWQKLNVTNSFWIRNNKEGTLASFNGDLGSGTNGATRYIAIGQAFWIQATGAPTFTITESVKASQQPEYLREAALNDLLRVTVSDGVMADEIIIHFDERADDFSNTFGDTRKFSHESLNLSSFDLLDREARLAINSMADYACSKVVGLRLEEVVPGNYSFSFDGFESFDETVFSVIDNFKGTTTAVKPDAAYAFEVTSDSSTFGDERFQILFSKGEALRSVTANAANVCEFTNVDVTVSDPQPGVSYFVVNSDGTMISQKITTQSSSSFAFSIPLSPGEHALTIFAERMGCDVIPVATLSDISVLSKPTVLTKPSFTCGTGSASLIVEGSEGAVSYQWFAFIDDRAPIATTSDAFWTTPVLEQSREYFVSAVNMLGCEGERKAILAEVRELPKGILAFEGQKLMTNSSASTQWLLDGNVFKEGGQSLFITQPGDYTLILSEKGCSISHSLVITPEFLSDDHRIQISPNPASQSASFKVYSSALQITGSILSATGQSISFFELSKKDDYTYYTELDISDLASGMYLIRISEDNHIIYKRLIKK